MKPLKVIKDPLFNYALIYAIVATVIGMFNLGELSIIGIVIAPFVVAYVVGYKTRYSWIKLGAITFIATLALWVLISNMGFQYWLDTTDIMSIITYLIISAVTGFFSVWLAKTMLRLQTVGG